MRHKHGAQGSFGIHSPQGRVAKGPGLGLQTPAPDGERSPERVCAPLMLVWVRVTGTEREEEIAEIPRGPALRPSRHDSCLVLGVAGTSILCGALARRKSMVSPTMANDSVNIPTEELPCRFFQLLIL